MSELPMADDDRTGQTRCEAGRNFGNRVVIVFLVLWLASTGVLVWQEQQIKGNTNHRLKIDEGQTCTIQARGLEAQLPLTHVMRDIDVFLEPPHGLLAKGLPKQPPVAAYYRAALADLRHYLPLYNRIEAKQPASRKC